MFPFAAVRFSRSFVDLRCAGLRWRWRKADLLSPVSHVPTGPGLNCLAVPQADKRHACVFRRKRSVIPEFPITPPSEAA